jgi:hypothetical protein
MTHRFFCGLLTIALAALLAAPAQAQLAPYSQDFEGLDQAAPDALSADGWLVFGNVFNRFTGGYVYGHGPWPAPNGTGAFSSIDVGQGGPAQGAQQLSVYSDYANGDHWWAWIESNVFQEQVVGPEDVGETWVFSFDAKRGNINDPDDPNCPFVGPPEGGEFPCSSTAIAFIKTLDPSAGWALTNFLTISTTDLPETWGRFRLPIEIDAGLVGQVFQFGFANTATLWQPSGVFYDNVGFGPFVPAPASQGYWHRQCLGVPAENGGIDPGRNGRGPSNPTEPGFVDELMSCAASRLEDLDYYGLTTCEGMDASPSNDACERALKQLTALILNVCSWKLLDSSAVDVAVEGCGATNVGDLIPEVRDLIDAGECGQAAECAAAANEGFGLSDGGGANSVDVVSEPEREQFRREFREPRSPRRRR